MILGVCSYNGGMASTRRNEGMGSLRGQKGAALLRKAKKLWVLLRSPTGRWSQKRGKWRKAEEKQGFRKA